MVLLRSLKSLATSFVSYKSYSTKAAAPLFQLKKTHNDSLLTVSFQSPPYNLYNTASLRDLEAQLAQELANPSVRLLVLESALPGMFSLGLDPGYILKTPTHEGRRDLFHALLSTFRRIYAAPVPTVAKIEGPCFAGGAVLALACDFRLMDSAKAKLSFSESKVGLPIPIFLSHILSKNISNNSHTRADFTVYGRAFDAEACKKLGFAVPENFTSTAEMDAYVVDRLGKASRLSRTILASTIKNLKDEDVKKIDEFLESKIGEMDPYLGNDFLGEGILAYVKQREPIWKH
eukprot:TRINITY_DN15842_c0_g1_i1.p1 TRINITY_DN15842_c0_g1~~TRINITY_DN15842_c0_g1_i1.p1  ORF type:complete len:290 (+),score=76.80 TRINITY_DN15842_c0_g1_i1:64-933(+)